MTTGPRSALVDAYLTARKIYAGDIIRLDAGCVVDGYKSDMARTFVAGDASKLITARYKAMLRGLKRNSPQCGPEQRCATFTWRQSMLPAARAPPHIGDITSGMALALVDMNIRSSTRRLRPFWQTGMCLCVETRFYELGWGGMMIEDTICVTENGFDPITTIPRRLFQLA
ncbi:M24 family metallopeptidase [Bradyrhizobium glycinis]|uniref:M24 family metallopeptidase n=1 Tax=Bradyrhizobium glycinis TaxID=2751812 RepID=UPI0018D90270|nr:M24 family metallopeptidase [Bradyrhizobium glycinis]MBH5371594.1 M24 family metallopeptidase [Bradyrhizobium glycinis]